MPSYIFGSDSSKHGRACFSISYFSYFHLSCVCLEKLRLNLFFIGELYSGGKKNRLISSGLFSADFYCEKEVSSLYPFPTGGDNYLLLLFSQLFQSYLQNGDFKNIVSRVYY